MSRTFKDKPYKLQHEAWDKDTERFQCTVTRIDYYTRELCEYTRYGRIDLPTTKTKKRKEVDTEDHWMTTPGWWVKMTMTKPERRAANTATRKVLLAEDIEEVDIPDMGRKPHIYFW